MSEFDRNMQVARRLCADLQWEGRRVQLGDFVALLDGRIVAVSETPDDAIDQLRSRAPAADKGMVVEVLPETVDVIR